MKTLYDRRIRLGLSIARASALSGISYYKISSLEKSNMPKCSPSFHQYDQMLLAEEKRLCRELAHAIKVRQSTGETYVQTKN